MDPNVDLMGWGSPNVANHRMGGFAPVPEGPKGLRVVHDESRDAFKAEGPKMRGLVGAAAKPERWPLL